MDDRRVALIASWSQRYIDDHRRWLELHGPHWDGWSHALSPDNRSLLRKTIASHGRVHFYAYMSRGQGGDGTVRYRLGHYSCRCSRAHFSWRSFAEGTSELPSPRVQPFTFLKPEN